MRRIHKLAWLAVICVLVAQTVNAQETTAEAALEQTVEVAEGIEAVAERVEQWAEENSEEIEEWAERYSGQWEQWAERFEGKMERWAAQQESEWEKWAEDYSGEWESWGSQFDAGDFNSEETNELIERNLEMLSKMPLGQMVDGLLKEGVAELKDAPWESLGDLKDLFEESFNTRMEPREELGLQGFDSRQRAKGTASDLDSALGQMRDRLAAEQEKLSEQSRKKIEALKSLLQDDDLTPKQRGNFEAMLKTVRNSNARRLVEARKKATKAKADLEKAFAKQAKKNAVQQQIETANNRATKQAESAKDRVMKQAEAKAERRKAKAKKNADRIQKSGRKRAKSMENELDSLREEIKQLRKELNELKKRR